jgi:hypothetical protein
MAATTMAATTDTTINETTDKNNATGRGGICEDAMQRDAGGHNNQRALGDGTRQHGNETTRFVAPLIQGNYQLLVTIWVRGYERKGNIGGWDDRRGATGEVIW